MYKDLLALENIEILFNLHDLMVEGASDGEGKGVFL